MSVYKSEFCPYCNKPVVLFERTEFYNYNRYLGLPYERCPHCKKIYSTGKNFYNKMDEKEKAQLESIYHYNIFFTSLTVYFIILIVAFFISSFILDNKIMDIIYYILILPIIPSIILGVFISKSNFKNVKQITLSNYKIDEELKNYILEQKSDDTDLISLLHKLE